MANYPDDLRYARDHEWVRVSDEIATIGITDFAQRQLGEVVFVELLKHGDRIDAGDAFGTVESVKAVTEVYMPFSAAIIEVNDAVNDEPTQVNEDPYGEGWMVKTKSPSTKELDELMSSEQYAAFIASEDT